MDPNPNLPASVLGSSEARAVTRVGAGVGEGGASPGGSGNWRGEESPTGDGDWASEPGPQSSWVCSWGSGGSSRRRWASGSVGGGGGGSAGGPVSRDDGMMTSSGVRTMTSSGGGGACAGGGGDEGGGEDGGSGGGNAGSPLSEMRSSGVVGGVCRVMGSSDVGTSACRGAAWVQQEQERECVVEVSGVWGLTRHGWWESWCWANLGRAKGGGGQELNRSQGSLIWLWARHGVWTKHIFFAISRSSDPSRFSHSSCAACGNTGPT